MRQICITLTLMLISHAGYAQDQQYKPPGIEVGEKAPDFELKDQLGNPIKLSTLLKKSPVAIVFHRSAGW